MVLQIRLLTGGGLFEGRERGALLLVEIRYIALDSVFYRLLASNSVL